MEKQNRFVLQEHTRGQSSHIDLRLEEGDHLIGFTLDDPGRVGNKKRLSNNPEKSSKNKILAHLKNKQPKEFLELKGNLTKDETSKLKTLDEGDYKTGVVKDNFLELFLQGKNYNGRFVVSKLKEDWFFWKPIKQEPKVLSSESIEKGFVPPQGKSALSNEWEGLIPSELRWWEKNWTGARAVITLKEIRKSLLKRNVLKKDLIQFSQGKNKEQNPKKFQNTPLSEEQIGTIVRQSLEKKFPSDIADKALCSKQSVIYWQNKLGLR